MDGFGGPSDRHSLFVNMLKEFELKSNGYFAKPAGWLCAQERRLGARSGQDPSGST
jgi:hypothetical protein